MAMNNPAGRPQQPKGRHREGLSTAFTIDVQNFPHRESFWSGFSALLSTTRIGVRIQIQTRQTRLSHLKPKFSSSALTSSQLSPTKRRGSALAETDQANQRAKIVKVLTCESCSSRTRSPRSTPKTKKLDTVLYIRYRLYRSGIKSVRFLWEVWYSARDDHVIYVRFLIEMTYIYHRIYRAYQAFSIQLDIDR